MRKFDTVAVGYKVSAKSPFARETERVGSMTKLEGVDTVSGQK